MTVWFIVCLLVLPFIILMAWVYYEISSGEKKWAKDREEYLAYLSWLKKGYYGIGKER